MTVWALTPVARRAWSEWCRHKFMARRDGPRVVLSIRIIGLTPGPHCIRHPGRVLAWS